MQHIHYKTKNLNLDTKIKLLNKAFDLSYCNHIDVLDCKISFGRRKTDLTYSEVMDMFDSESFFTVIERNLFENYGEIGFSSDVNGDVTYFLFLELNIDLFNELITEFKLEKL